MGFLGKTVFAKRLNKSNLFVLAFVASIISCGLATSSSTFAAEVVDNYGLYTAPDGVRWEWEVVSDSENTNEPQKLNLMFYDKPENLTTVTVPSYIDITTVSGVTPASDTYYVRNANQESQDTRFANPDPARRTANQADVTVLDMTNTSKVQIMGVKPIINPETEVELIFGENMVIGDGEGSLETDVELFVTIDVCTEFEPYAVYVGSTYYQCANFEEREFSNFTDNISINYYDPQVYYWVSKTWDDLLLYEKKNYQPTLGDIDCLDYYEMMKSNSGIQQSYTGRCLADWKTMQVKTVTTVDTGAFANYKLKLTNLEKVKYIGWYAFQNAVFNESSRDIIIKANQTAGEGVFANTNVTSATFETQEVFPAMFKGCQDLVNIDFGNVDTISYEAFENTNLGQVDFSSTNVKNILGLAFKNAGLLSIDLEGVEKIGGGAFANNDLTELYLPKSISDLSEINTFAFNKNLTKLTIAYDTLTTGTLHPLHTVMGGNVGAETNVIRGIKELNIIAPYGQNDELKSTHISYCDYENPVGNAGDVDVDCHVADSYKNVIARSYFYGFNRLEKITIGDGYEYIGSLAFYNYPTITGGPNGAYQISNFDYEYDHTALKEVVLPETLKGIGMFGLGYNCGKEELKINLPKSLEYIDAFAFYYNLGMHADVDLPNLKVLGTHAFFVSGVHNVHLYDKLERVGHSPFQSCFQLNDVIIDFDVFNPEKNTRALLAESVFTSAMFGHIQATYPLQGTSPELQEFIGNLVPTAAWGDLTHKLGNIIFTEKVQTEPSWWTFYGTAAKKIDISKTGWTRIPDMGFLNVVADEILLPEGTTRIGYSAFYFARIKEELVIPDSVKTIDANAFQNDTYVKKKRTLWDGEHAYKDGVIDDSIDCAFGQDTRPCSYSYGVKITSLPTGLESIGRNVFSMDDRFTADINLPNITTIEDNAFAGTSTRNIVLGSNIQSIGDRAFTGIGELDSLIIDCDIVDIYTEQDSKNHFMSDLFNTDTYGAQVSGWSQSLFEGYDDFDVRYGSTDIKVGKLVIGSHSITAPQQGDNIVAGGFTFYRLVPDAEIDEYGYCVNWSYTRYEGKCFEEFDRIEPFDVQTSLFYGVEAGEIDLSEAQWTTIPERAFQGVKAGTIKLPATLTGISKNAFYEAEIDNLSIPESVTTIDKEAFEYANIDNFVGLPEGVITIGEAAFYGASLGGDFVIPASVTSVGVSAFNAGGADTHYDTVTIKAPLDYEKTNNQAVFQMFWNAKMDKLVIDTSMLPVLGTLKDTPILPDEVEVDGEMVSPLRFNGEPEFHAMTMREVVIKNLPQITANAFEDCANLEKVDLSGHDSLTRISHHAFNNADKLKTFVFGDGLVGKDVALEEYAFRGTAIETMGDKSTDFALTAANFNAEDAAVFSEIPKLTTVYVPSTFTIQPAFADAEKNLNGSTIPAYTFANDPELKEVTLDYQLSKVDESAFLYDNKLEKLFVWGNTIINENDVELTIPEQTTIFAYSDAPAEAYANADSREDYDGKFYALDEVLYLTSNKYKVLLNEDKTDFGKTGLKLYGLRRDGVILESDWQDYNTAFKRTETPEGTNISFEEGRGALGPDDAAIAATVFDAPKPFNTISLANENFANVDYEFVAIASNNNPLIVVHYPDGYTGNIRNTTLVSTTVQEIIEDITDPEPEEELEVPDTGSYGALIGAATSSVSIAAVVVLGGIFIAKKQH